jgi:hypothetical protein
MPPAGVPTPQKIGPVASPQTNPGNQVQAMAKIGNALKELQEALPAIPMGSELHTAVMDVVKKLIGVAKNDKPDASIQLQELVKSLREASSGGPQAALARMIPPGAGPNAPPATATPIPPKPPGPPDAAMAA